jgi:CRP/FNR family transcriptional regulator
MLLKKGPLTANIDVHIRYTLEPEERTIFVIRDLDLTIQIPGLLKVAEPLVVWAFRKENVRILTELKRYVEAALRVAEYLSETYNTACREIRALMLSRSAAERFARLLLEWSVKTGDTRHRGRFTLALSHEEIAQMIGTSRETVTRLFADFKKKELLQRNGSTVVIRNPAVLETLIAV